MATDGVNPARESLDLAFLLPEYDSLAGVERHYIDIAQSNGDTVLEGQDFERFKTLQGASALWLPERYYSVSQAREFFIEKIALQFFPDQALWERLKDALTAVSHLSLSEIYALVFLAMSGPERYAAYSFIIALEDALALHRLQPLTGEKDFATAMCWAIDATLAGNLVVQFVTGAELVVGKGAEFEPDPSRTIVGTIRFPETAPHAYLVHEAWHAYRFGNGFFTTSLDDEAAAHVLDNEFSFTDVGEEAVFTSLDAMSVNNRRELAEYDAGIARWRQELAGTPQDPKRRCAYISSYAWARVRALWLAPEHNVRRAAAVLAWHRRHGADAALLAQDEARLRDCLIHWSAYEVGSALLAQVERDYLPVVLLLPRETAAVPVDPSEYDDDLSLPPPRTYRQMWAGATGLLLKAFQWAVVRGDPAAAEAVIDRGLIPYLTGNGYLNDLPRD
jgi:hypothetical protein